MPNARISYAIGDIVRIVAQCIFPIGHEGVITACDLVCGELEYGVDGCAWFGYATLELVSDATPESLQRALAHISDEDNDIDLDAGADDDGDGEEKEDD